VTAGETHESDDSQDPRGSTVATDVRQGPPPRRTILIAVFDLAAPIGLYYGLHALGTSDILALLLAAVIPGISAVYQVIRNRRVDGFAIFIVLMLLLSIGVSFLTGSVRFLLAKDGWLTGVAGLFILGTMVRSRPFGFQAARPLLEGRFGPEGMSWDEAWDTEPRFRRVWRGITLVWGVGLILDAVARVVMAYTLPVDVVPGLGGGQYIVVYVILQVITQVLLMRSGFMRRGRRTG
jgi:intracellular septation protein A